ncbi:FAD-dependent oxidoreductase [Nocardioides cavernae]|uniref:FAD-dependent oxidoreductase n=1 Tax=Nocardioides cavernae TaxID=1921566 RepID=A0ABR8N9J3_9ACTN|nr:FAD-dependent oxidoreductase [Nocardioides cavernae]MBD3924262.1 FAD-dependent oxidoreductase [Nocardioides cavernae]MBM7510799.1 dimethylamine/trimethylamine dehydrogenase [Nocardioides cavernae]
MRDSRYDLLFEPIKIGPKTLRNRFVQVPHCTNFGTDLPYSQAALRAVKAEGGWAMINTEYCSISPESDDYPRNFARLWDEDDVANLSVTTREVHKHESLAGVELWYGSIEAGNWETRMAGRGVSGGFDDDIFTQGVYEMTVEEILELQQLYVDAADRAMRAGFDVINVYAGHFHSIAHQFMTPYYNKRTDQYGGSLENRCRFLQEVLVKVRDTVGDNCAVGVRFGFESQRGDAGITASEEGYLIIQHLDDLVDFWDLQVGTHSNWNIDSAPSRTHAEGFNGTWMKQVKPFTSKPVIGVGRYVSPDAMLAAVRDGEMDIIGAARPSIADPFLPKKIEEGRFEDIRECIGCNMCIGSVWGVGSRLICTQNATAGEEYRRGWHPESFSTAGNSDLNVLVVGAGPAGLECARVLGERGMSAVHVADAASSIGGSLDWIAGLPGLSEWRRVLDWRSTQIDKLANVELVLGRRLSAQDILEYGADLVVCANGSSWDATGHNPLTRAPLTGVAEQVIPTFTPEQLVRDGANLPGQSVLIYDFDGYFMAVSIAELLAAAGKQVTIVTPEAEAGGFLHHTGEFEPVHRRLHELKVQVRTSSTIEELTSGGAVVVHGLTGDREIVGTDSVVLTTQRNPNDDLYRDLTSDSERLEAAGITGVYRAGDCVVPRRIVDAVFDGHRLAREIDSPDPRTPLPFHRERIVAPPGAALPLIGTWQ